MSPWHVANAEYLRAYRKTYNAAHKVKTAASNAAWYAANRERHSANARNSHYKKRYGITLDDYNALLATQGGGCAVCGQPPNDKALAVDHNHSTGAVRGLLCDNCNRILGHAHDSPAVLLSAIAYLAKDASCGI